MFKGMYMLQLVFIWINGQMLSIIIFTTWKKQMCAKIHDDEGKATWRNCDFKN